MKAKIFLKSLFLLPALLLTFTSCKSDDPEFGPYSASLIIMQEGSIFKPYMVLTAVNGELKAATITRDGALLPGTGYYDQNVYVLNPDMNFETSLSGFSGTYNFYVESAKGETGGASQAYSLESNKALGEIVLTEFSYENGYLSVKLEEVENATAYGFYLEPYVNGQRVPYYLHYWSTVPTSTPSAGTLTFGATLPSNSIQLQYDALHITPFALNRPTAAYCNVLRKAGDGRMLRKDATAFEPIAEPQK